MTTHDKDAQIPIESTDTAIQSFVRRFAANFWSTLGVPLALLVLFVIFSLMSSAFLTSGNLVTILRQASVIAIAAIGTTIVLIAGGIDISQGAVIALAGIAAVVGVQQFGLPDVVAITIALVLAGAVGLANGFFAEYIKIPAFIATLGTAFVVRGAVFVYTEGRSIGFERGESANGTITQWLGKGFLGPLPVPVVLMLLFYIIATVIMQRSVWGLHTYAIGSSARAAQVAGLRVQRHRLQVYALAGLLAGAAGVILTGRLGSGAPNLGTGTEFDIITAVVLGGTSIYGGRGTVARTLLGALFLATMTNGLILLNVPSFYQQITVGAVLLGALTLDRLQSRS